MAPARLLLFSSAFAFILSRPAAAAEAVSQSLRTVTASAADLFVIADRLAKQGQRQRAERILELLSRDANSDVRNEARYRQSLLLETAGATKAASVLLRRILDEKPDSVFVRLKLAAMLHRMGDEDSALRELRALHSADLPPAVARFVDRIAASLQMTKRSGVQVEIALAPDSNINRATRSQTLDTIFGDFTFDDDAKQKSGVGVAVRAVAHRRIPLRRDISLVARATTDLNVYPDKHFDDISAELSAGPEFRLFGTRFTAEVGLGRRWYGMRPYQGQVRISGRATQALDTVSQGRVDASLRRSNNMINDLQDGRGITVRAQYERALSAQMSIGVSATTDRFVARDRGYSTRSWTAGLTTNRDMGRTTLSFGVEMGGLKADERLDILPQARRDRLIRFNISAVFRRFTIEGFAPLMRMVIERNRSNIEFYDYKRTRTEIGISRAF